MDLDQVAGQEAVYLPALYEAETYIAQRMGEMSRAELLPPDGLDRLLKQIQRAQGITYAPQQLQAVRQAAQRQVMLLTGGPGTGKTTCLRGVLALFEAMGLETALAAPTGRAAKRLGELCSTEASTIHRLLETGFDPHTGQLVFTHDEYDPLKADAVIVDEVSMVDVPLMAALMAALRGDCRLVLVGDPDQLPSVGPGNLFSDLIRSGAVPTVRLTEIFRQAAQSAIVRNAHMVNSGELPDLRRNDNDFFCLRRRDPQSAVETIVDLCRRRLPERMGIPARPDPGPLPHPAAGHRDRGAEPGPPGRPQSPGGAEGGAPLRRLDLPGGGPGDAGQEQLRHPLAGGGRDRLRHGDVQRGHRGDPHRGQGSRPGGL